MYFRIEHLKFFDATEPLPILAAVLKWCKNLMTVDLPEINFYAENEDGNVFDHSEDEDESEVVAEYFRFFQTALISCSLTKL